MSLIFGNRGGGELPQKTPTKPKWRHEDVTAPAVDDYLYSMLPPRDEVLAEMEDYATKHTVPIVGPAVARDGDAQNAERARRYFARAGVAHRIDIRIGDALELLSEQRQEFDIIFCDVDKEDYPRAFRLVAPRLRQGGLFITDNVLWSGRVVEENPSDARTKAVQEFNRLVYKSSELFTTILPIRDGVAVALKL